MARPVSTAPQPGDLLADKFRIVRTLGSGGMGSVFEVEHVLTKHRRALKLLHRGLMLTSANAVPRFLREASAAGRIGNPHIVETFDAGQLPDGAPYIVMELLQGKTLSDLLESEPGGLAVEPVCDILCQACDAIAAAHAAGIVHRDLKPDNLFVVSAGSHVGPGARPHVKVLDFGVSKFDEALGEDRKLTATGTTLGTPLYMAPEQLAGDPNADGRVDVYALGVVLYELLTGLTPYPGPSVVQLVLQMHQGAFTPLRELRPDLPLALDAVVARALAFEPSARFPNAALLRQAIASCELAIAPTTPATQSVPPPPLQSRRRNLWAGLLALALAAGAAAIWLWTSGSPARSHGASEPTVSKPVAGQMPRGANQLLTVKQAAGSHSAPAASAPSIAAQLGLEPIHPASVLQPSAAGTELAPDQAVVPPPKRGAPEPQLRQRTVPSRTTRPTRAAELGLVEENPL